MSKDPEPSLLKEVLYGDVNREVFPEGHELLAEGFQFLLQPLNLSPKSLDFHLETPMQAQAPGQFNGV